ncbi:MAG: glycosyltransferase, partial [Oscillospiraceae bacterium]|nr:glycosyltransferase [Oscillospiraceae bacterium]
MKILLVSKFYPPHIGGIENVVKGLAEGLNEKAELEVLVCQKKGAAVTDITDGGVLVNRCDSFGTFLSMPLSLSFINEFKLKSKDADIIHIHLPFPLADIACLLAKPKGKIIISWHSDIVRQKKLMFFYRPIMDRLLYRADLIVTATQRHITSSEYLRPYKSKCHVIPYGLDIPTYEDMDEFMPVLEDNLWLKKNKKALFVGRLVYYKGLNVLIESFKNVRNCELFIAGTGKLKNELER